MSELSLQKTEPPTAVEFSAFGNITHFADAQRMAKALSSSAIVPTAYQGENNIGSCVIALEIANRIGASVLAVMQNLYVVHGKPGWSSQFLISCINASKKFTPLRYKMTGTKGQDDWGCVAWAQDKTGEILESPEVTIGMAKAEGWYGKTGSKWKTMPELMLRYRTATLFARLYAPELTMGIQTADEVQDIEVEVQPLTHTTTTALPTDAPKFTPKPKAKKAAPITEAEVVAPLVVGASESQLPAKEPEPAPAAPHPETEPTPEPPAAAPEPVKQPEAANVIPLDDLKAAMKQQDVSDDKLLAFAKMKGLLKDGADADMPVLSDIKADKVELLAKHIRAGSTVLKQIKGV
jgi:hypothetical protein